MNDFRFDWFASLKAPFVDELASHMFPTADAPCSGVNVELVHSERISLAKHVLSSLYQAYTSPHAANTVSYPKKNFAYKLKSESKVPYSYKRAIEVFDRLCELSWVSVTEAVTQKLYTRIEASGALSEKFEDIGFVWFEQMPMPKFKSLYLRDVKRDKDGKVIRTIPKRNKNSKVKRKRPKPKTIKFDVAIDNNKEEVIRMQNNLHKINSYLVKQCITLDLDDEQLKETLAQIDRKGDGDKLVDLRRIQLTRIFSRGSMNKGGRFYRGWWQEIPSRHRPHIRINGKKTVEIDFTAMHLRILYAKAGLDFSIEKDPYNLGLDNWEGKKDPRRKVIKKAINALLNDEDNVFSLGKDDKKVLGLTEEEFEKQLQTIHPKLKFSQYKGIGLELQKLDSDIAEALLLWMVDHDIPCLPVHDSFIVTAGCAYELEDALKRIFKEFVNVPTDVETDIIKIREHFGMTSKDVDNIPMEYMVIRGKDTWAALEKYFNSNNLMDNYLRSYESTKYS